MIPRYSRKEMAEIWSDKHKLDLWLEIELLVCDGWARIGRIPKNKAKEIRKKARYDINRVYEIEKITKHDVAAFVDAVAENIGPLARYLHLGLTSSDVLDTAFNLQLVASADILTSNLKELMEVLRDKAHRYKYQWMIGRTHGIHAEPISFGLVMALWYEETKRNLERMKRAQKEIRVGKLSGAVGTYWHLDPRVEDYVLKKLGLEKPKITSQIIQRDRHAFYFTTLAIIASSIEKFATNIRHLQRTEVREVEEFFSEGQKGSSAMPHKRNPVLSENICGLARLIRANAISAMENVALWHERDISHSSVERIIGPDSNIALDFLISRFKTIIENLVVYPEQMYKNLELTRGLIFSESVMTRLIDKGLTRQSAYQIVQRNAMKIFENPKLDFLETLKADNEVIKYINKKELKGLFDLQSLKPKVDFIFQRVFGKNY